MLLSKGFFLPAEMKENETMDWYEPKIETFRNFILEVVSKETFDISDPHRLDEPRDSIFNASKQMRRSATCSSVPSERLQIATEKAVPQIKQNKNAVEMKKDRLQAELNIAASEAKLNVLNSFHETSGPTGPGKSSMNGSTMLYE